MKPNVCRHALSVALERVNVTGEWYHVVVDWYCPWLVTEQNVGCCSTNGAQTEMTSEMNEWNIFSLSVRSRLAEV